jgi:hypothetical protein
LRALSKRSAQFPENRWATANKQLQGNSLTE